MTRADIEGRSGHEGRNCRKGDKVDNETETEETHSADDPTADDSHGGCDNISREIRNLLLGFEDDGSNQCRHNCNGLEQC